MEPSPQAWLEVAKQVPALLVMAGVVIYLVRQMSADREASEARIVAQAKSHNEERERVNKQQDETIKALTEVVRKNNECLGSIATLISIFGEDLKNANRAR